MNIRNTDTILYVMKNGEMFEGDTLNQLWPQASGVVGGEMLRVATEFPECWSRHAQISRPGLVPRGSDVQRSNLRAASRSNPRYKTRNTVHKPL